MLVDKFPHTRFEPSGFTGNDQIPYAKSITDYIFRWMATKFLSNEAQFHAGVNVSGPVAAEADGQDVLKRTSEASGSDEAFSRDVQPASSDQNTSSTTPFAIQNDQDAPPCSTCGAIMIRNGACYKCVNCGATSGCA